MGMIGEVSRKFNTRYTELKCNKNIGGKNVDLTYQF